MVKYPLELRLFLVSLRDCAENSLVVLLRHEREYTLNGLFERLLRVGPDSLYYINNVTVVLVEQREVRGQVRVKAVAVHTPRKHLFLRYYSLLFLLHCVLLDYLVYYIIHVVTQHFEYLAIFLHLGSFHLM